MPKAFRFISMASVLMVAAGTFPGRHNDTAIAVEAANSARPALFRFDFGGSATSPGYTAVSPETIYSEQRGYGFEPGGHVEASCREGDDALRSDCVTSAEPFRFSIKVPEGNYRVTMILGDSAGSSTTTVKAELRRLMLHRVVTAERQFATRTIIVNVRMPQIAGSRQVGLKDRERASEWTAWDEKLTLEFNDVRPCLCAMEISRVDDVPTIYLLGDSTVCDQPAEPWNSWGQMLPRFLTNDIAVANHAESGESLRSSLASGRVAKVLSLIGPGDFLLVQFGHNDMKDRSPNALATYESDLRQLVGQTRARDATPILVTSMERKAGISTDTLGRYPEIVRRVAQTEETPLIDLHAMSKMLYAALGDDLDKAFQDGTHHNNYGSYELARCVVAGIGRSVPNLAGHIAEGFVRFDPAQPDSVDTFEMPASPNFSITRLEGD